MMDGYDFLHEDKHFPQFGTVIFTGHSEACPEYSK